MPEKSPQQESIQGNHEKISYTAIAVAYARTFSDIPYSKEISDICDASNLTEENAKVHHDLAPYFEARFKGLTNLIKKSGIKNILEVASGVDPRGLIMAEEDPEVTFMETDLPDMLRQKRNVLDELCKQAKIQLPKNLHFAELNVLDEVAFRTALEGFPSGPIAIGNEGLLAYFNREEKQKMAEIIHDILVERGGVWVTPDIFTVADLKKTVTDDKKHEVAMEELKTRTQRKYESNAFIDVDDAKKFFTDLGFEFNISTIGEAAGDLASAKIGLDEGNVRRQLSLNIWELKVKK
jgi:O-methyltransferase involved in polyketide biosynthesis